MIISNQTLPPKKSSGIKDFFRKLNYLIAIVVNVILLLIAYRIPEWEISFITDEFEDCLPFITFSLGWTIVLNGILLAYDPYRFRHAIQILLNLLSLLLMWATLAIFPFDFEQDVVMTMFRLGLIFGIIVTLISFIPETGHVLFGEPPTDKSKQKMKLHP
jgi:hypothetical protein